MPQPSTAELTDRELEVMHAFWARSDATAAEVRDYLAAHGTDLSYPTVANLVRILVDKHFLKPINQQRPFRYQPTRSHAEVSRGILGRIVERVFRGSREEMLVRLIEQEALTPEERELLEHILKEQS